jgi:predicted protein tyrosine phosphatase
MAKIKTLCLCAGGVVRSVTLCALLKYYWKHDALAASLDTNSTDTKLMLMEWADHIYIVEPDMWCEIPEDYKHKTRCLDIGPDKWGKSMEPELQDICYRLLEQDLGPDRRVAPWAELLARREARYPKCPCGISAGSQIGHDITCLAYTPAERAPDPPDW